MSSILSHLNELHILVIANAKIDMKYAKLQRKNRLAMINLKQLFNTTKTISCNNKDIDENSRRVFIFATQFLKLIYGEILKIS